MITWNNLDTLASYKGLFNLEKVNLKEAMSGESGAERVKKYSAPMAEGLAYNFAAKRVDGTILETLQKLADEAQLTEKFEALYNGEVINTGEKRRVLHHLTRGQLGNAVEADGVDKRAFYTEQQNKIADFAKKVHSGEITNAAGKSSRRWFRSASAEATWGREPCISPLRTGRRRTACLRWKRNSSAMWIRTTRLRYWLPQT